MNYLNLIRIESSFWQHIEYRKVQPSWEYTITSWCRAITKRRKKRRQIVNDLNLKQHLLCINYYWCWNRNQNQNVFFLLFQTKKEKKVWHLIKLYVNFMNSHLISQPLYAVKIRFIALPHWVLDIWKRNCKTSYCHKPN